MINVVKYEEVEIADTPHQVDVRKLFESEHVSVVEIKLGHGQSLKKHVTPVDVFFYILEGQGVVEIGDEQVNVSHDMLIESPKGIPHLLSNDADEPLRFLVVKTPRPAGQTKIL
jgi:mannose-6-phosphate isomerase-like protein (cupin superfamily)